MYLRDQCTPNVFGYNFNRVLLLSQCVRFDNLYYGYHIHPFLHDLSLDQSVTMPDATTRADTLIMCVKRLQSYGSRTERLFESSLHIHFAGADYSEGKSPNETLEIFKPFVHAIAQENPTLQSCTLSFVGPNISRQLHQQLRTFRVEKQKKCSLEEEAERTTVSNNVDEADISLRRISVHLYYFVGSYENFIKEVTVVGKESLSALEMRPQLIVSFNAGIWGYDDWIPAIKTILENGQCPWLITSYNKNEAEDDEDVLNTTFPNLYWYWKPQKNPMGAKVPRQTRNDVGSTLWENDCWMCVGASTEAAKSGLITCKK